MASPTYTCEVIVLKKTKLGEADLIVTCLTTSGAQMQFVAKGARKPTNSFASRLELFSHASILAVQRPSLDLVKEVRLLDGFPQLRESFERSSAAQVVCEFLCKATEPGLDVDRLFAMTQACLNSMATCGVEALEGLAAAFVTKGFAFCGLRPELDHCVCCGREVERGGQGNVWFSYIEGGVVCPDCRGQAECLAFEAATIEWLMFFMHTTFADIAKASSRGAAFGCLQVCQQWCRTHLGTSLKSIEFLLTNPLW